MSQNLSVDAMAKYQVSINKISSKLKILNKKMKPLFSPSKICFGYPKTNKKHGLFKKNLNAVYTWNVTQKYYSPPLMRCLKILMCWICMWVQDNL